MGLGGLQDLGGVIGEEEAEKCNEALAISGEVAEERGGAFGEGGMFGGGSGEEPVLFVKDGEDVGGGEGIFAGRMFGDVVAGGHAAILAQRERIQARV